MPYNANQNELEILDFWKKNNIFEKSVNSHPVSDPKAQTQRENKPYVFYDGPPFATGLPHYGHIVASLMKDVVPRYWTMRGFRVERKWGWDCHGLPIENIIEKDLKLGSKKEIEEYGIGKFNEACRATVMKYADEWKKIIPRMGRWVDMENDYKTMDRDFMESVWWVFKELWNKGLIYEGYKAMHICPRCVTVLSNFEVTQGYKDVKDLSVTVKFKLEDVKEKLGLDGNVYVLAWTTTPWTLPGNVALAVGENIKYCVLSINGEEGLYILAKERIESILVGKEYKIVSCLTAADLVGLRYEPPFLNYKNKQHLDDSIMLLQRWNNAFKIYTGNFVNTEDGTGVVHIAPAFGEDDMNLCIDDANFLPFPDQVQHVSMDGKFKKDIFTGELSFLADLEVKPKDEPTKTDVEIIKYLANQGKLFSKAKYEHSYPHCWRCDTPLLNYSTSSWFVRVTDIKDDLLKNNAEITWVPEHIKEGRFGKWLEGARDWAISRNRYWGCPLPVWKSDGGEKGIDVLCIGSVEELEKLSGEKVADLHKHFVDKIVIKKNGREYTRIPEVLDCWFESGSMPYGQMHYPFENKEKFESGFPAEFIAEGQDQTRGWFYTLHVLSTALTQKKNPSIQKTETCPAFKNVIVNGIVLAEDGKKMSKRLQNYPDPMAVLEKYGADAMRYYLVSSPVMYAEGLNFSEKDVWEMYNKVVNTLYNVLTFYQTFADERNAASSQIKSKESTNILDKWILTKLYVLVRDVTEKMNEYKLAEASRPILDFITELSQWYVRRSRDRFKQGAKEDRQFALATLCDVLLTLSKVMAPFTPFIAEKIYLELTQGKQKESVHLEDWPQFDNRLFAEKTLQDMETVRKIVEMGLSLRVEAGVKVRQPLSQLIINTKQLTAELQNIIADELNVKLVAVAEKIKTEDNILLKEDGGLKVALCVEITAALKKEGLVRELVHTINQMRKEQKLTTKDRVNIEYTTADEMLQQVFEKYGEEIKKSVLANNIFAGNGTMEKKIDGKTVHLSIVTLQ